MDVVLMGTQKVIRSGNESHTSPIVFTSKTGNVGFLNPYYVIVREKIESTFSKSISKKSQPLNTSKN